MKIMESTRILKSVRGNDADEDTAVYNNGRKNDSNDKNYDQHDTDNDKDNDINEKKYHII